MRSTFKSLWLALGFVLVVGVSIPQTAEAGLFRRLFNFFTPGISSCVGCSSRSVVRSSCTGFSCGSSFSSFNSGFSSCGSFGCGSSFSSCGSFGCGSSFGSFGGCGSFGCGSSIFSPVHSGFFPSYWNFVAYGQGFYNPYFSYAPVYYSPPVSGPTYSAPQDKPNPGPVSPDVKGSEYQHIEKSGSYWYTIEDNKLLWADKTGEIEGISWEEREEYFDVLWKKYKRGEIKIGTNNDKFVEKYCPTFHHTVSECPGFEAETLPAPPRARSGGTEVIQVQGVSTHQGVTRERSRSREVIVESQAST